MNRRETIKAIGLASATTLATPLAFSQPAKTTSKFKYCLNTSTIRGQKPGLKNSIEIAARAGYDSLELWVMDVKAYKEEGSSMPALKKFISDSKVEIDDAIGFASWMADDEAQRQKGFEQMKMEMDLMAEIGCTRIAAPAAGVKPDAPLDLFKVGERYKMLLDLGRKTGVMPQLEFWGPSPVFYHFGQALMAAAAANDPDVKILPDVYHLFRGGSGYDCLKMVDGNLIDVIHMNDFPANIPREQQNDSHRVYPGDGAAPLKQVFTYLANMGGTKVLSLELFNPEYWKGDAFATAKTGLEKMKKAVASAGF
jgi:sugar phosphate isomerase/epimerase